MPLIMFHTEDTDIINEMSASMIRRSRPQRIFTMPASASPGEFHIPCLPEVGNRRSCTEIEISAFRKEWPSTVMAECSSKRAEACPAHLPLNLTCHDDAEEGTSEFFVSRRRKNPRLQTKTWICCLFFLGASVSALSSSSQIISRGRVGTQGSQRGHLFLGVLKLRDKFSDRASSAFGLRPGEQRVLQAASARGDRNESPSRSPRMSPVSAENNGRTRQKRATGRKVDPLVKRLLDMKREVQHHLKTNNLSDALRILSDMMTFVGYTPQTNSTTAYNNNKTHTSAPQIRKGSNQRIHMDSSLVVDETIRLVTNRAFTSPFGGQQAVERVHIGFQAIEMQLSCECALSKPYNTVPRWTLLRALMALTALRSNDVRRMERHFPNFNPSLQAFRILQRLITGGGVRESLQPGFTNLPLDERDFSMVLNSFVNDGKMDMAHKVVALQERTEHAPPLSPVAYSILIKGYGRSHDIENVKMILSHADSNGVIADTIMLNSVIDAYVNCDCVDEATRIFNSVRYSQTKDLAATRSSKEVTSSYPSAQLNQRTYNTILKGLAKVGDLTQALKLSNEMRRAGLWDDITTNTLVNAAVTASKFDIASKILRNCTSSYQPNESKTRMGNYRRGKEHPNIEAYTELLDGYGKAGMTDKAIGVLKLMQERGVEPNEITFTCAIGALARDKRISQAKKMFEYMEKTGVRATSVTYNTFIAGLVADPPTEDDKDGINNNGEAAYAQYNTFVSEALILTGKMIENRVMPNAITISVLVDAMGRCNPPRMGEAQLLVKELDKKKILPLTNERVATSLIKIRGRCGDILGASESFQMIENPDVIALNAFLDACCRVGNLKLAFNTFKEYAAKETHRSTKLGNRQIEPDVITYSVLLSALFSLNTNTAAKRARILYRDMKRQGISADIGLVDVILKAMIMGGPMGIDDSALQFTIEVLRDAEKLDWEAGQLETRNRAVRGVLVGRMSEVWKENEDVYGMGLSNDNKEDQLFKKKGWNKVDSGFRLWGRGNGEDKQYRKSRPSAEAVDDFLKSKGWNNVDSGFRII